jgi:hypothetical protein
MLSYTQRFVHGGAMMFTNATSLQKWENPPADASSGIPLVTANIGNIRPQPVRGTGEDECRAQDCRGQSEHECRVRFGP